MGKNVLYVTNYYLEDVIAQRSPGECLSQAGQNKGTYIIDMLECGGNHVTVWSNAWTKERGLRRFKGFRSKLNPNVYYSDIIALPVLNAYSCLYCSRRFLKRLVKERRPDVLIFYNMRLENSRLALYAKKKFGIPIILQYEDGLTTDEGVGGLKRKIYKRLERQVLHQLDGAFLVNSKIKVPCPSVVIRGAVREDDFYAGTDRKADTSLGAAGRSRTPGLKLTFLFASTLDQQRGTDVVLEALSYTNLDFTLKITGRGEAEERVKACTDPRVRFLGYLDYSDYKKELSEADICINAQLSRHAFGGFSFPSKIFEYLSAGKPVVSSDVADTKEALSDALFLYYEDDPKQLAAAMERAAAVCMDEKAYAGYRAKISEVIRENSISSVAENVNRLFEKIGA